MRRLRLVTFNIAHGRGLTPIQGFTSARKLRLNLRKISALLGRLAPDVVALQEVDECSRWSGSFDHRHVVFQLGWVCPDRRPTLRHPTGRRIEQRRKPIALEIARDRPGAELQERRAQRGFRGFAQPLRRRVVATSAAASEPTLGLSARAAGLIAAPGPVFRPERT
jgi:hypothetical protein